MKVETDSGRGRSRVSTWTARALIALTTLVVAGAGLVCRGGDSPSSLSTSAKLLQGALQRDLVLVKAALSEGADVNCRDTNGVTPLIQTVVGATKPLDQSQRECVAFLLEQRADVDAKDSCGRTALIHATIAGDLETVRLLVRAGAFIPERDRFHKNSLLYASEGHREILIYLGRTLKAERGVAW